ncbi:MAG: GNAT family N-acetyltransferase [Planctomycetota bacterium]
MSVDLSKPAGIAEAEQLRIVRVMTELTYEHIDINGGAACYLHPGSWMNNTHGLGHRGPIDAEVLEQVTAFYAERGVPAQLDLAHTVAMPALPVLAEAGYRMSDIDDVYRLDLPAKLPEPDASIVVREVSRAEAGEAWLLLSHRAACGDEQAEPTAAEAEETRRVMEHPRSRLFVAEIDGVPVGTAGLETADPVAALFAGATLPSVRRRGVQRALIIARLRAANASGCAVATIGSEPAGPTARNVERLGFTLGFVRFEFTKPHG